MEKQQNKQLPKYIYRYKGQQVFLADTYKMPGVEPLAVANDTGCYPVGQYNGCYSLMTYEDGYASYVDDCEIMVASVINVEAADDDLCDDVWTSVNYAAVDRVEQHLCRKGFIWSELHDIIGDIENKVERDHETGEKVIPYSDFRRIEEDWNATIREYEEEYEESVTEDNVVDFPEVMSLQEICDKEDIIVAPSDDELEELADDDLKVIQTTNSAIGYPSHLHPAIVGFKSFDEAEAMAKENHLQIQIFERRSGWSLWRRGRTPYCAFERSGGCVMDYEDDDWHYAIGVINLKVD